MTGTNDQTGAVIVSDAGFAADDWTHGFVVPDRVTANNEAPVLAVHLAPDADPGLLVSHLHRIDMIRVAFHAFSDGRGFTIARQLRDLGFQGRLRAAGHVIADQYAMARRAGFDEIEIDKSLATRQPQAQWQARANWQAHDYQSRLRSAGFS